VKYAVVARLRNITCFSLDENNEHIAVLVADLNSRMMKRYGKSRRQVRAMLFVAVMAASNYTFSPSDTTREGTDC